MKAHRIDNEILSEGVDQVTAGGEEITEALTPFIENDSTRALMVPPADESGEVRKEVRGDIFTTYEFAETAEDGADAKAGFDTVSSPAAVVTDDDNRMLSPSLMPKAAIAIQEAIAAVNSRRGK